MCQYKAGIDGNKKLALWISHRKAVDFSEKNFLLAAAFPFTFLSEKDKIKYIEHEQESEDSSWKKNCANMQHC